MKRMPKSNLTPAEFDALVLGVLFLLSFWYLSSIQAFEQLVAFVELREEWQLDELLTSVALIGLGGFVFAVRRFREAKGELVSRMAAEAKVSWLAHYDPLTELPNRRMLTEFVRKFDHDHDHGQSAGDDIYAVYSIDLDGFKKVNDLHGHAIGDQLLKVISWRLTSLFPDDLIVRLGGDEFLVIARPPSPNHVTKIADRIGQVLGSPMKLDGVQVEVGASVGYVLYPSQVTSLEEAIRCSDIAMYAAKRSSIVSSLVFHEDLLAETRRKASLEEQLRIALSEDRIVPYYQPLVDLQSNKIYGFEVLARWFTRDGETVAPSDFIPVADDAGLISDLSEKLLRKACMDASAWPDDIMLSFNLSPTQLSDQMIGLRIVQVLNETGFRPQRLEIEITESAMIIDSEAALSVLDKLQQLGIQIALDDFGTGYSSLSQMSRFRFSRLKIDQSFIREFEHDDKQYSIVRAIIALGNGLNVAITAEGIEEPSQLAVLKKLGCNSGQGYLLGRPMSADLATQALGGAFAAGAHVNRIA